MMYWNYRLQRMETHDQADPRDLGKLDAGAWFHEKERREKEEQKIREIRVPWLKES